MEKENKKLIDKNEVYQQLICEQKELLENSFLQKRDSLENCSEMGTTKITSMYGDIIFEDIKMGKALSSNLGRANTQHGEAAEKLEVRARNKNHILKNEETSAENEKNRFHTSSDIRDGNSTYQLKFCKTPEETLNAFLDLKHDYSKTEKMVPEEQYERIMELLEKRIRLYSNKATRCKEKGDLDGYKRNKERLRRCKDLRNTLKPSSKGVTRNAAVNAANHPGFYTAKTIVVDAISAGLQAGGVAAVVSGTVQGFNDICAILDGKMSTKEAIKDVSLVMAKVGGITTAYAAGGALVKGVAKEGVKHIANESSKQVLTKIANTNSVIYIAMATIQYTKVLVKYFNGEIEKERMLIGIGDTTVGLAGSLIGGMVGEAIGGPIGSVIGSTIMSMACTAFYHSVVELIQLKSVAKHADELIPLLKEAQFEAEKAIKNFEETCNLSRIIRKEWIKSTLLEMNNAIQEKNIDSFIGSLETLMTVYGEYEIYTDVNVFKEDLLSEKEILI